MKRKNIITKLRSALVALIAMVMTAAVSSAARADDATRTTFATAEARSSTWIAVQTPFTGDANGDGHTIYEIGLSRTGPFETRGYLPGPPEWRANVFYVSPNTAYFVRITFVDPDGVSGPNPQTIGPIRTPASASNMTTVDTAIAEVHDTEIFVSVPIRNDANGSSSGTIDVATSPSGPWTRKCGPGLSLHPKRGRIRGLTPGTSYWVRVSIADSDGIVGSATQIIGPIRYTGLQNLALGKRITADYGWGCCPDPRPLVDGRIQYDNWYYGFAWTGGNRRWAGGPAGVKQATIDLGATTTFNRAVVWYHDTNNVPLVWGFQYSNDGVSWKDAFVNTQPICRTATLQLPGYWGYPAGSHDATFPAVTARYFRYVFDDRTLFDGIHGWAVELEVFQDTSATHRSGFGITDLIPVPGGGVSFAYGLNALGQSVCGSRLPNANYHAATWDSAARIRDLGTFGGPNSTAFAINAAGDIVGQAAISGSRNHAFLWSGGRMTDLSTLGGPSSAAFAINAAGDIVGFSHIASGLSHATLWRAGKIQDLGTLGGYLSYAYGINESGQIVGYAHTARGNYRAALWSGGRAYDLGALGGQNSAAFAINASGLVVGWAETASWDTHATLWRGGTRTDLGTLPGHVRSYARAINSKGLVVGWSETAAGLPRAFCWDNGKMTDLNTLIPADSGWTLYFATGVNDRGQIVGTGAIGGRSHGFLLTPR